MVHRTIQTVLSLTICLTGCLTATAAMAVSPATSQSATLSGALLSDALLPDGTSITRTVWVDDVLHIDLTLPDDASTWSMTPVEMEALAANLGSLYAADEGFGGVVVRVRIGTDGDLRPLESFVSYKKVEADTTAPAVVTLPDQAVSDLSARIHDQPVPLGIGGPVTNAARQPTGALSGVTVFCSGGHGWTASTSANDWILQRPIALEMNEDHGNLDQLNYFVQYAYNAGATVVPFRPVGYQPIEIVLDNDDPGVTYTGAWADGTGSKYYENGVTNSGIRYKSYSSAATESATARFTPAISTSGFYPVYCFALAGANRVRQLYRISHSGGISDVIVDHHEVGNGWIYLGEYYFEASGTNYVEISNESPDVGAVIADAIRFGNGMGDISRPGPNTISGYPRNEECSRYWANSEAGNNAVGFTASDIWDSSSSDQNDNISTASRWSREMNQVPTGGNQVDRWRRVYLEFHSNASTGGARGSMGLVSASAPTTNQSAYAATISDEIDADMQILDSDFEHTWYDRASSSYTAEFGAISTYGNSNEFDATIIEVAFHDNQTDAELIRDSRVRAALARSSVQGIVRFLNTLPGSQVPLAFAPDPPTNFRVEDAGSGNITLSWNAPPSDGARGDAATGYVVYESTNGYGFGNPVVLANVLTTTISGVPASETRYFRVAATNAGGESMPSETLSVRRPTSGTATVLIVNGFDSLRRFQNPTQNVGGTIERQTWRNTNAYDYAVLFAEAMDATTVGFTSCSNEAIQSNQITLGDYDVALWILGAERSEDAPLDATEQSRLTTFLTNGGSLFISGAEIGFDLVGQNQGITFMQDTLKSGYSNNDAGTFNVISLGGSIFDGVGAFDFDPANGAPYTVYEPDVLAALSGATSALAYSGGIGGTAAVQYDASVYRTVTFGFPFETITSSAVRADMMARVLDYLGNAVGPIQFDFDSDGDVDIADYGAWVFCFAGPDFFFPPTHTCAERDADGDLDVDLADWAVFQQAFTGP